MDSLLLAHDIMIFFSGNLSGLGIFPGFHQIFNFFCFLVYSAQEVGLEAFKSCLNEWDKNISKCTPCFMDMSEKCARIGNNRAWKKRKMITEKKVLHQGQTISAQ